MSQILVNKASGDSVLQVLGNKAEKKLPNRPGFTHVHLPPHEWVIFDAVRAEKPELIVERVGPVIFKIFYWNQQLSDWFQ